MFLLLNSKSSPACLVTTFYFHFTAIIWCAKSTSEQCLSNFVTYPKSKSYYQNRKLPLFGHPPPPLPPHPSPQNPSIILGLYTQHHHIHIHTHTSFLISFLGPSELINYWTNIQLRLPMTPCSSCSSTQVQKAWLIEVNPTHGATHISDGLLIGVSDQYSPGNMIMLVPHLRNSVLLTIFPVTHALSHTAVTGLSNSF